MNQDLWRRIETALDARSDPFDDPRLAGALAADPELERAARRLVARLGLLGDSPVAVSHPGRARRAAAVAAALFLLVAAALYVRRAARTSPGPPRERISTVSLVVEHTSPPPARGARVVLEPRFVMEWSLEGVAP